MSGKLVIFPLKLKLQAPFPLMQRRQLVLFNVNARPIAFSVCVDTLQPLEVQPQSGRICGFHTTELCILLHPVAEIRVTFSFEVRHVVDDCPEEEPDWMQSQITLVHILLEDSLQYQRRLSEMFELEFEDDGHQRVQLAEPDCDQLCPVCSMRQRDVVEPERGDWLQSAVWATRLLLVPLVAYVGWNWRALVQACGMCIINY